MPRAMTMMSTTRATVSTTTIVEETDEEKNARSTTRMPRDARRGRWRASPFGELAARANAKGREKRMTAYRLIVERENAIACVTHAVKPGVAMFLAGGLAGALAKSCTAPLDRLKIIMQSAWIEPSAASVAAADKGLLAAFAEIGKSEGLAGYWRGNVPQVIRILPYSSAMLFSYDVQAQSSPTKDGELSVRNVYSRGRVRRARRRS